MAGSRRSDNLKGERHFHAPSWSLHLEETMGRPKPIEYDVASPEVRAVFDDIKATRNVSDVNNFWKYLASDPSLLKRTWSTQKEALSPGALDLLSNPTISARMAGFRAPKQPFSSDWLNRRPDGNCGAPPWT